MSKPKELIKMDKENFESEKNGICDKIIDELYDLWVECGEPETEDGPTTEELMPAELLHDIDLGDESTNDDIAAYESVITGLYNLIDIRHIGSGIWYTQYYTNSEFEKYADAGKTIINEYIKNNLWDDFCNNHKWDMECVYKIDEHMKNTLERWNELYDKLSEDYEKSIGFYDEIIDEDFDDWKEEYLTKED